MFTNDIILLNEKHTDKSSEKYYNTIPGYIYKDAPQTFIHPCARSPSGGIGIFIRCDLMEGIHVDSTDEKFVWLRLKSSFFFCDNDKMIGCAYFSRIDSSYIHSTNTRTDYFNIFAEQVDKFNNGEDIFLGGPKLQELGNYQIS